MSTTTQPNDTAPPATVTQAMARLVLLANWNNLPEPQLVRTSSQAGITIDVATLADIERWIAVLGGARTGMHQADHDGGVLYFAYVHGWHGHAVTIQAHEMQSQAASLDAETMADLIQVAAELAPKQQDADTVAGLEEIAAPAESSRIPAERVNELLADLNRRCQDQDWRDWIAAAPEFDAKATAASSDSGTLHLTDGTVFVWERQAEAWAVSA